MLNRIPQLYTEWQSLHPLQPQDQKRLEEKFRLEFNYNSNHIEGNTLTYGQTKLLLIFERTEGVHELREYEEMKAHDVALKMIIEEAKDKERPLTVNFIRTLNETILVRSFWKDAQTQDGQNTRIEVKVGEYKSRPNHVRTAANEIFHYATVEETPAMMKDIVEWFNFEVEKGELNPIELAALLHYRYIRIHPFEDGNGRIARLLVNYVLFRYDYPMVIVLTKDKNNYLRALNRCDVEVGLEPIQGANANIRRIQPFVEYLSDQLVRSFEIAIKAAKGESIEEDDDFEKELSLLERKLKISEIKKPIFKPEYVWDIIDIFYLPFSLSFIESLKPLNVFFKSLEYNCRIDRKLFDLSKIHLFNNKDTEPIKDYRRIKSAITSDLISDLYPDKTDFYNPKKIKFEFSVRSPFNPKLSDVTLSFKLVVLFKSDEYIIQTQNFEQSYNYGCYPLETDSENIIYNYKKEVLKIVENAIN